MTPDRFRDCLDALGWSQRFLADYLGMNSSTSVNRYATGQASIPANLAAWLEYLAAVHDAKPLPDGWTRRSAGHHSIPTGSGS